MATNPQIVTIAVSLIHLVISLIRVHQMSQNHNHNDHNVAIRSDTELSSSDSDLGTSTSSDSSDTSVYIDLICATVKNYATKKGKDVKKLIKSGRVVV